MSANRVKRPKLERERPHRDWSTLFGAAPAKAASGAAPADASNARDGDALSDTVELGYRVIDDYLRQGRQASQSFGIPSWPGVPNAGSGSPEDLQQMAQRVMQYGWDFAGLWFEMWNRMGGAAAWPMPGAWSGFTGGPSAQHRPPPAAHEPAGATPIEDEPQAVSVSVDCPLPTTTSLELRPGNHAGLVVHALRAEGHDAPPIGNVTLEQAEDGPLIRVVIAASQPAGKYRAAIVDGASNLPRGALTVRIQAKQP